MIVYAITVMAHSLLMMKYSPDEVRGADGFVIKAISLSVFWPSVVAVAIYMSNRHGKVPDDPAEAIHILLKDPGIPLFATLGLAFSAVVVTFLP